MAIINQAFARQYFPNEEPVGKQITYLSNPPRPMEIVGIVEDLKEGPLDIATVPALYRPFKVPITTLRWWSGPRPEVRRYCRHWPPRSVRSIPALLLPVA